MKRMKCLNKLFLALGCGAALVTSVFGNAVYAADYDSISNGYYRLYGNFWWEGTSSQTERGTSWYATPPTPNSVYKPNAVEIGTRAALGYEVESIAWYSPSSAPTPKAKPGVWTYEKRCYVYYRRALTTPQTGSITVSNAYRASSSLYWVKENTPAYVTYKATQDFNGTSKGFEDYITKNYISFAVNGGKINNPYITNGRWVYSITNYNSNSLLSVSYKEMKADNVKGDTNRTMYSSVYASLKGNGTEVELGGKSDSANGKSSALTWSGIKIKCDAKNPTANISDSYTSNSAIVTFSASDGESGLSSIQYKLSGAQNKDWTSISNNGSITITALGNTTVYVKAIDNVGNTYETSKVVVTDTIPPSVSHTISPSGWTKGDVTIQVTASDSHSGLKNITLPNGSITTSSTVNYTVSANGIYVFKATDNSGNVNTYSVSISNIDKTAPTISLSQNPTYWTNGNVTVTANITETGSGINTRKWAAGNQNTSYFANSGTTITSNSFTATSNGTYTFYVKDNAGNESVKTITISNIDKVAPTISLSQNPTYWTNGNVTVTANITETGSGINTRKWAAGNQNTSYFANSGTTITSNSFTATSNGTYTFYVKDNAGNEKVATINISNIDKTAPTITLSQNPTAWTKGDVTVTASITETGSGINTRKWASGNQSTSYFTNSGTTITSNSFTATSNGTYTFYVKDNAGNEKVATINISNIDKTLPTITGTLDYPWIKGTRTISFTSTDNESGINSLKLWNENKTKVLKEGTVNNKTASLSHVITEEGITKYKIESIDNVNNVTTKDVVVRIDNTAPEGIISMPNITSNKKIEILFSNLIDTYSGLKEAMVAENSSFSGSNVVKVSLSDVKSVSDVKSTTFTLSAKSTIKEHFSERKIYVRLVDNVGNYKDYTFSVFLIPQKPDVPQILTPVEDQLYVTNETINLSWTYNSVDEDVGYLPQQKAEIELENVDTGTITTLTVEGEVFNKELKNLENGEYKVKVRVYNFETVYEESKVRIFRFNKFKDSGNVLTIDITPGSPIRYISILTESEIPNGTSLIGKVYYHQKSTGEIDKTQYINFKITNLHTNSNIIKLPETTGKIKIEYFLKGSNTDKTISPILDNILVYGK